VSLYVYSLSDATLLETVQWPPGLGGAPIEIVQHAGIALIASTIDRQPSPVRREDLQIHNTVNQAVLAAGVCVPLRYGTMQPGRQACVEMIERRLPHWQEMIERVRGRVEISIKGLLPSRGGTLPVANIQQAGPGTTAAQGRRVANQIQQDLLALAEAVNVTTHAQLVDIAALVRHDDWSELAMRIADYVKALPGRWKVGAPWPPYSFVGAPSTGIAAPRGARE
jgi:hypothetical protein